MPFFWSNYPFRIFAAWLLHGKNDLIEQTNFLPDIPSFYLFINVPYPRVLIQKNIQCELSKITSFLESNALKIKCLVDKQRKKRQAQKLSRDKTRATKQKQILERQAKHRQIDAWLQEQRDKVEKAKRVNKI
jgi:hypothetical protein